MPSDKNIELVKKGIAFHQKNQLDKAFRLYTKVLKSEPDNVDALHFLGLLYFNRNELQAAFKYIKKAIGLNPAYSDAYLNLGNIYLRETNFKQAQACYEKALELDPQKLQVTSNLGILHRHLGNLALSEKLLKQVTSSLPSWAEAHYNLGNTYRAMGNSESAVESYKSAISINATLSEAYQGLLDISYREKKYDLGAQTIESWEEATTSTPVLQHLKAAYSGKGVPTRASTDYVVETFDNYAESFEASLAKLEYSGPQIVGEKLLELLNQGKQSLNVLDAGCGTGLACLQLKPYASKLIGIDLSKGMLSLAKQKNAYDRLIQGDIEIEIAKFNDYFDVIAAIDTLIYLGDLEKVFKSAQTALRHQGLFIGTVEATENESQNYKLEAHGRYQHSKNYIRQQLKESGFTNIMVIPAIVRKELSKGVDGWLFYGYSA